MPNPKGSTGIVVRQDQRAACERLVKIFSERTGRHLSLGAAILEAEKMVQSTLGGSSAQPVPVESVNDR